MWRSLAILALAFTACAAAPCANDLSRCGGTTGFNCCVTAGYSCTPLLNGEGYSLCLPANLPFGDFRNPQTFTIPSTSPTTAVVIFLHGFGMTGSEMMNYIRSLIPGFPGGGHIRWVFPEGPVFRFATSDLQTFFPNTKSPARGWFDAEFGTPSERTFGLGLKSKPQDLQKSANYLGVYINRLVAQGIPANRIILAGFSQGATLAMHTGLVHSRQLAGVVAFAGGLIPPATPPTFPNLAMWLGYGREDKILPFYVGQVTARLLRPELGAEVIPYSNPYAPPFISLGMKNVQFNQYSSVSTDPRFAQSHRITEQGAQDAWTFIKGKLPPI